MKSSSLQRSTSCPHLTEKLRTVENETENTKVKLNRRESLSSDNLLQTTSLQTANKLSYQAPISRTSDRTLCLLTGQSEELKLNFKHKDPVTNCTWLLIRGDGKILHEKSASEKDMVR